MVVSSTPPLPPAPSIAERLAEPILIDRMLVCSSLRPFLQLETCELAPLSASDSDGVASIRSDLLPPDSVCGGGTILCVNTRGTFEDRAV